MLRSRRRRRLEASRTEGADSVDGTKVPLAEKGGAPALPISPSGPVASRGRVTERPRRIRPPQASPFPFPFPLPLPSR